MKQYIKNNLLGCKDNKKILNAQIILKIITKKSFFLSKRWDLHRQAVDGAMLADDGSGIDGDDVAVGKCLADDAKGFRVVFGLTVNGGEDGSVENQKVGVGRRKALSFLLPRSSFLGNRFLENCIRHWQSKQSIGLSVGGSEAFELLFQRLKIGKLFVVFIVAAHVEQRVVGCTAYDSVDVAVSIVANEVAVVEPHDTLGTQSAFQFLLDFLAGERLVAIRCQEALRSRENRAVTVAFDAAALENEILMVLKLTVDS